MKKIATMTIGGTPMLSFQQIFNLLYCPASKCSRKDLSLLKSLEAYGYKNEMVAVGSKANLPEGIHAGDTLISLNLAEVICMRRCTARAYALLKDIVSARHAAEQEQRRSRMAREDKAFQRFQQANALRVEAERRNEAILGELRTLQAGAAALLDRFQEEPAPMPRPVPEVVELPARRMQSGALTTHADEVEKIEEPVAVQIG